MHAKRRNQRVQLYRSTYVRKGAKGNSHGYAQQEFVGSLPAESLTIPSELAGKLTEEECRYVERAVIEPARCRAAAEQLKRETRERDPNWRIAEAARLLREARSLTDAGSGRLEAVGGSAVMDILEQVQPFVRDSTHSARRDHPLKDALDAINQATRSVKEGRYGKAPAENVRATEEYQLWAAIKSAVDGDGPHSLLRAMQHAGFAKSKVK